MVEKINNHFEESRFDVSDNGIECCPLIPLVLFSVILSNHFLTIKDMFKFGIYDFQYLGYNPVPYQNIQNFLYESMFYSFSCIFPLSPSLLRMKTTHQKRTKLMIKQLPATALPRRRVMTHGLTSSTLCR